MKRVIQKTRSFWRRLSRWTQWVVISLVVLLLAARLALPYVVRNYVNHRLSTIPDYSGHVEKIHMNLYRGAYTIEHLRIVKTNGNIPVPFISMPALDLSIQWRELFHGAVVGKVVAFSPEVNFVNGPSEKQQQTGMNKDWKKVLEDLFPFRLNRFDVVNGDIRFRDFSREPKVDIYITNLQATATNLTNTRETRDPLPAGLVAQGKTIGMGKLNLELHMNPMANTPTFKLAASVTNMDLVALNSFMRAYGNFDVAAGNFEVYTEIAASNGRFEGYVKPFFEHLDVFDWDKERKKNILKVFWEAIVAGVAGAFKNQPHDRLATKIPISGTFEKTDIDIWATIGGILRNAFVRSLLPQIDRTVRLGGGEADNPEKPRDRPSSRP